VSEDEDVDSGWDAGEEEEAPVTRAVDSRRLLAQALGNLREHDTMTPPSPPAPSAAAFMAKLESEPPSEPPETRRATDDEVRQMRTRAGGSAIRLGGKTTPPVPQPEAPRLKRFEPIHNRPTPPAGVKPPTDTPLATRAVAGPGAGRSLRLDAENHPKKVMAQQRRATLMSRVVSEDEARPKAVSEPPLEIHLDSFDLPDLGGAPPSERRLPTRELSARLQAETRPPPPPAPPPPDDDLDALPVDEMLATARSSSLPPAPRPAPPPRLALQRPKPEPPPVELVAPPPDASIEFEESALSEEEALALEEADDPELTPVRERFERGDYFGAALRAEALLERRPDFAAARRYLDAARDALVQMYIGRLGSGSQVLRVAMRPDEIQGLSLDHRSGFLISLIDGVATLDEILDMSGMPPLDALRLLYEMREQGVVVVDSMIL
jgi:hypothetical protein